MADAAGIALGLPGLFVTGVQCFDWIQLGREFKGDFVRASSRLDTAHLRLLRWGTAMGLEGANLDTPDHDRLYLNLPTGHAEKMSEFLTRIKDDFARAEATATKYRPLNTGGPSENDALDPALELAAADATARTPYDFRHKTMTNYKSATRGSRKLVQRATWVFHDRSRFDRLVDYVIESVKDLEDLFAPALIREQELCRREIASVEPQALPLLLEAVKEDDKILGDALAVEVQVQGLEFRDIKIGGKGKFWLGSEYGNVRVVEKSGNKYSGMVLEGEGQTRLGNSYGMPNLPDTPRDR